MKIRLPNGKIMEGIPEGTTKQQIREKAILSGLATQTDFDGVDALAEVPTVGFDPYEKPKKKPKKPSTPLIEKAKGLGEAALSIGTGALLGGPLFVASTIEQIGQSFLDGTYGSQEEADRIYDHAQYMASTGTYSPRTQYGREILSKVAEFGDALTPLTPLSPAIAQQARLMRGASSGKFLSDKLLPENKTKKRLIEGDPSADLAALKIEKNLLGLDSVKKDKKAKAAIENDFSMGIIQPIKNLDRDSKLKLRAMAEIKKLNVKNEMSYKRPSDVIGGIVLDNFQEVRYENKRAGKALNEVVKTELKGEKVDLSDIGDDFVDSLDELGVNITNDGLDFSNSAISFIKPLQKPLNDVFMEMDRVGESIDALGLHRLKRQIDNMVTYGSIEEGLSGDTDRILKSLRTAINQTLKDNFPKYREANEVYSETIGIIDELQRLAGKKLNLDSPNAEKALGTLMKRLSGNAVSRVPIMDLNEDITRFIKSEKPLYKSSKAEESLLESKVLSIYTGETRNSEKKRRKHKIIDIKPLVSFERELDRVLGTSAKGSLQGDVSGSLDRAAMLATQGVPDAGFIMTGIRKATGADSKVKLGIKKHKKDIETVNSMLDFLEEQIDAKNN
jgi:hypothetical protein